MILVSQALWTQAQQWRQQYLPRIRTKLRLMQSGGNTAAILCIEYVSYRTNVCKSCVNKNEYVL